MTKSYDELVEENKQLKEILALLVDRLNNIPIFKAERILFDTDDSRPSIWKEIKVHKEQA